MRVRVMWWACLDKRWENPHIPPRRSCFLSSLFWFFKYCQKNSQTTRACPLILCHRGNFWPPVSGHEAPWWLRSLIYLWTQSRSNMHARQHVRGWMSQLIVHLKEQNAQKLNHSRHVALSNASPDLCGAILMLHSTQYAWKTRNKLFF